MGNHLRRLFVFKVRDKAKTGCFFWVSASRFQPMRLNSPIRKAVNACRLFQTLSSFAKFSSNFRCYTIHFRYFKTDLRISKTHDPKFYFDDSQLLHYLSKRWVQEARRLLEKSPESNRQFRVVQWTSLLSKYCKNGYVDEAQVLFEIMPDRNLVTYNAMLSGYVQSGRLNEACQFFEEMPERNVVSWTSMLCGLADAGKIEDARKLFDVMPERNVVSWNSMVAGLVRNGDLEGARWFFVQTPGKNIISWNAMIAGYAEHCRMEEARILFDEMEDRNVITWTSMIAGYCRAGNVEEGYYLFQRMPEKNVVSWTAMIGGFTWNGLFKKALLLFLEMRTSDTKPNGETFVSLAYACAGLSFTYLGKQLHAQLIINNWDYDDYDGRLCRGLIHMYSMLGIMGFADSIFRNNQNNCNTQSFNSMINGYIQIGQLKKAQYLFDEVPVRDWISWTCLITGYFGVGQVPKACNVFNNMPDKDAVAWTAMISGHVQNELFAEANCLFAEMRAQGVSPLNSTYSVLLGATGAMANLDQGRKLHCMQLKTLSEYDLILENSLISMYAKCGEIEDSYSIFLNMTARDVISWNTMIMGFSYHGRPSEAVKVYEAMIESGTHPNSVTFLGVLSASGHAGLVDQGWELLSSMINVYELQPGLEHYICMINLLGRAGKVKEAEQFVLRLPFEPDHAIWGALLGVCGLDEANAEIARRSATRLLELDPLNAPGHVVLCNFYAANGWHAKERELRKDMGLKGVKKVPGCSWISLKGNVDVFLSGDRLPPQVQEMLLLLFGINAAQKERTLECAEYEI
ncbi:Pentatricopeptide repeat-containing protein [Quillaja saponaria]|uniref:Pentatricopeptide repeat-containing protein n=1 Tax=Quillaja saponaria TaxID=32244 RepID=A0AAD7LC43_QUISA|nr:Pentatricopeptide repeat-containing protein [Quillaja saponaria]